MRNPLLRASLPRATEGMYDKAGRPGLVRREAASDPLGRGLGNRPLRPLAALVAVLALASCGTPPQSVGDHVIYKDRLVEVPRPCPVTKPARPAPLARPLPTDPGALVSLLVAKLAEYAGPGGYADKADSAITTCTKPN